MLACFLMVLGQLSQRKIAPNPKINTNPNRGAIFFGGSCPDTFPHDCSYNIRFIFTKGAFTYCVITGMGRGGL